MTDKADITDIAETPPIALVLGVSGAIGGAIAAALHRRGYHIRALARHIAGRTASGAVPIQWVEGDALDRRAVMAAATGVQLIVHAVNPPGYARWREDGLPMLANTIEAARQSGATILFPANVYVFGAASPSSVDELTPKIATTRKGKVRIEMEAMLEEAASRHGVRVIALRAGDFFGPGVTNSWFSQALAAGGRSAKALYTLARPGVGHAWAYVPDLAETFARLADRRDTLAPFEMVHFAGHYDATGREMAEAAQRAIKDRAVPIRPFRWMKVYLGAPFVPFLREALEMLWLWKHPLRLDNTKLRRLIGDEPHTPLDRAVEAALA